MGKLSREKGKAGEREVAALLRKYGFEARRGQQFAGGSDSPDVVHSMDGWYIEVKRREAINLYAVLEQAGEEAGEDEAPVIFFRRNRQRWVVIMDAEDFLETVSRETAHEE